VLKIKDKIMSLDVSLIRKFHVSYDNGKTLEERTELIYEANITHNLGEMAEKTGIYKAVWRPHRLKPDYNILDGNWDAEHEYEKNCITLAKEISSIISEGLKLMKSDPERFKKFDSPNGWGTYKDFIPWLEKYLEALENNPDSIVEVDR
jgi:hypothetical protein